MLNLLLKEQKQKIIREYRNRFIVVALALALAGEAISLILLVPSFLTAQTRIDILNSQSADLKVQNLNAETLELSKIVQKTNSYINILSSSSTPIGVVNALQIIVKTRGTAINLSSFLYRMINGQMQIIVSGRASSRQTLLDFVKKIKLQQGVISADLPVSDFAKAQNIDFAITIIMNPKNQ